MAHPQKLGKYEIVEVLGEGAMGVVYKGFDPDIHRTVALKTIRSIHDDDGEAAAMLAARFRNEARAAGRLSHPGIVSVFDYGDDQGIAYIAMEFVEGQSLAHYLSHKVRFKDEDIAGLMIQLLDALHHAHEAGVWHRDVKPANIILAKNGRLKVADFGIARIDSSNLTQVHTMLGTPAYMAPEQFKGEAIDRRVDVYAAGVMLYVLLTNRPPFVGSPESLMYKVLTDEPKPPSQYESANRPRYYDALVANAMAKDPAVRYATALDFKTAIERAIGDPVDTTIWERTIIGVPVAKVSSSVEGSAARAARAAAGTGGPTSQFGPGAAPGTGGGTAPWTQPPTNWDRSLLAQAESTLARFVGPLAGVMVRRAARDCPDLPSLYSRLAQEVTDPGAKAAFAKHLETLTAQHQRSGATNIGGATNLGAPTGMVATNVGPAASQLASGTSLGGPRELPSEALIEQARKLLLAEVGPIAGVLVKKAAAGGRDRAAFIEAVVEAVSDPTARQKLRETLGRG